VLSYDGFYDISFLNKILGTNFLSGGSDALIIDNGGTCKYDKVAVALFQLVITEVIVLVFAQIGGAAFNRVLKGAILKSA
jgi:hypothetical protein